MVPKSNHAAADIYTHLIVSPEQFFFIKSPFDSNPPWIMIQTDDYDDECAE